QVLQEESADRHVRARTASAYRRVGSIRHVLGQWDQADRDFRQSIHLLDALTVEFPEEVGYRQSLLNSLWAWAILLRDTNKNDDADAAYVRIARLAEQLLADAPERAQDQSQLAKRPVHDSV